jgi:hypothetical protein
LILTIWEKFTKHTEQKNRKAKRQVQRDESYLDRATEDELSSSSTTQPSQEDDEDYDNAKRKRERLQERRQNRAASPSSAAAVAASSMMSTSSPRGVGVDNKSRRRRAAAAAAAAAAASTPGDSVDASTESGRCGYPMAWNAEFQKILELPQDDEQQQVRAGIPSIGATGDFFLKLINVILVFTNKHSWRNLRGSAHWRRISSTRPKRAARSSLARRACPTNSRPSVPSSSSIFIYYFLFFIFNCNFIITCKQRRYTWAGMRAA